MWHSGEEGKVCHLVKGLYGLKQAGHGWYQEMSWVLIKDLGFTCSTVDHSVFFQCSPNEHMIIVVTMDDMAVTSKQAEDITRFKADIQHYWEITNNGPIQWFLGVKFYMRFMLKIVRLTFYYHLWSYYIMCDLMLCAPPLSLVSSSLTKLRREYYFYIFYLLTLIHTLVIILGIIYNIHLHLQSWDL